jgi:hypothetical protein
MTILVAIVPLLCLGTLLYVFYDSYQEKTSVHLGEQVLRNAQSIDAFLDEKLSNLRQEAGTSTIDDLSSRTTCVNACTPCRTPIRVFHRSGSRRFIG